MTAQALDRTSLDATAQSNEMMRSKPSLRSAGFCVYQACTSYVVTGMFTSHRADPSWT